jgi:hypothetical protein
MELNSVNTSTKDKSLDYYNYCAPALPAHSRNSLRSRLTLSSGQRAHKSAEILSPDSPDSGGLNYMKLSRLGPATVDTASDSDILSPPYASVDDFKVAVTNGSEQKKMKHRSASCDCLDDPGPQSQVSRENGRPDSLNAMYDKLGPLQDAINGTSSIYDSLSPSKNRYSSGSSSPDTNDDFYTDLTDPRTSYLRRTHKYEYIGVELESRGSDRSNSNSPIGMELPSDWTKSLPLGVKPVTRESRTRHTVTSGASGAKVSKTPRVTSSINSKKETKTLPRRKQLPLQESGGEQSSSDAEYSTVPVKPAIPVKPPSLSRKSSAEVTDAKLTANHSHVSQDRLSVGSLDAIPGSKRGSVFSSSSASSVELEAKTSSNTSIPDHIRREHSNSPSHRVTREDVAIMIRNGCSESPQDHTDSGARQQSTEPPPPIPRKAKTSQERLRASNSPPLPPRPQEQPRFTVPLPQAEFNFEKPPPPPRPKVLCPSYAAVTFANGESSPQVEHIIRSNRPSVRIAQMHGDVSYVAVDFEMTAGLQRTSEQVANHQREFFETKQQS